jgi:GNAT superfamily N-acetyltransferase
VTDSTVQRVLGPVGFLADLDTLITVYGLAMRPPPQQLQGRRSIMERHAGHPAFRAVTVAASGTPASGTPASGTPATGVAAADGDGSGGSGTGSHGAERAARGGPDGRVIAFAYGFRGASGQWWHDVVRSGITAAAGRRTAAAWLADCFEVAEVHVRPEYQGQGIGRAMLRSLTAGCPQRTAVLSTLDAATPARCLYSSMGFTDLLTSFTFPGNGPPYAVMGAALPLRNTEAALPRPSR